MSEIDDETFLVTSSEEGWKVSGDVDAATAPRLAEAFAEGGEPTRPRVVIDMSDVEFMDSSGLRVFIDLSGREGIDEVVLRDVTRQVSRLIEITGLESVFSIE